MHAKKYTHLFFDLDNTIWDFNSNSYEALYIALAKLGVLDEIGSYSTYFSIYQEVNERLWELYRQGLLTKKVLGIQRFEESFEKHGTPLRIGGEVVNAAYLSEMPFQTKLIDGARHVLDYLHGRYEVAIITNGFKEVQYDKILKSELSKYFRKIFISEEVGYQKPRKQIFEHAVKSMNAPKSASLMIGDSWEADILGARDFGMDQIYFNPKLQLNGRTGYFYSGTARNIPEILEEAALFNEPNQYLNSKKTVRTALISELPDLLNIL